MIFVADVGVGFGRFEDVNKIVDFALFVVGDGQANPYVKWTGLLL